MNKHYTPTEEELTAYVLGECSDSETAAIEAAVAKQPETAELLEAIRETVALSEGLFASLGSEELSDEQRAEVASAAETVVAFEPKRRFGLRNGLAVAAMLAVMAGVVVLNSSDLGPSFNKQAKYELSDERMEIIRKLELATNGTVGADIDYEAYQYMRDDILELMLKGELGIGIERFMITDINNPAGSAGAQFDHNDYSEQVIVDSYNRKRQNKDEARLLSTMDSTMSKESASVSEEEPEWFAEEVIPSGSAANNGGYVVGNSSKSAVPKSPAAKAKPEQKMERQGGYGGSRGGRVPESTVTDINQMKVLPKGADSTGIKPYKLILPTEGNQPASAPVAAAPPAPTASRSVPMRTARTPVATSEELRANGILVDNVEELESHSYRDEYVLQNNVVQIMPKKPGEPYIYIPIAPEAITPGTEGYDRIVESQFKRVEQAPLSTFSIDVDTASYSNMRRFLTQGQMPPVDSVRIEELINYFNYDYPQPEGEDPFSSNIEVASAPWNPQHKLVRIGLKGQDIVSEERPASNLVFLLDVSGSMSSHNKLPLVKQSIQMLTQQLTDRDRVAIVVYAGNSGLVLPSTPGNRHEAILGALERLNAGGSTNGGAGIELAYRVASENFIKGGVNRVILASDGDYNVGNTSREGLVSQIEQSAKSGVFLSVLGFGMGNLKDATMENLADKGNGNYAYIDTFHEAQKVLVEQMNGTLYTIAKDVKIQVEFNPNRVQAYRLIGYENRALANRDFNDDTKDAGEIGAGHTVTALYEIIPSGIDLVNQPGVDKLKYQPVEEEAVAKRVNLGVDSPELLTVKLRYKQPDGHTSKLLEFPVRDVHADFNSASNDFKFASAVAVFGMKLRHSPFAQHMSYDSVLHLANSGLGHDLNGYRGEFLGLVRQAKAMNPQPVYHQQQIR